MDSENDKTIEALMQLLEHMKRKRNELVRVLIDLERNGVKPSNAHYQYMKGMYEVYRRECKTLSDEISLRRIVIF